MALISENQLPAATLGEQGLGCWQFSGQLSAVTLYVTFLLSTLCNKKVCPLYDNYPIKPSTYDLHTFFSLYFNKKLPKRDPGEHLVCSP